MQRIPCDQQSVQYYERLEIRGKQKWDPLQANACPVAERRVVEKARDPLSPLADAVRVNHGLLKFHHSTPCLPRAQLEDALRERRVPA